MPSSSLPVADITLNHIWDLKPSSVLDIGPGHGKFAVLCREYVNWGMRMHAIEAIQEYVDDFGLADLYDDLVVKDVMQATDVELNACDVVLMADVIEHLVKDDGIKLLSRIKAPVVISTPVEFFDNPETHWSEVHRSLWTLEDFLDTDRVIRYNEVHGVHVVTLRAQ